MSKLTKAVTKKSALANVGVGKVLERRGIV